MTDSRALKEFREQLKSAIITGDRVSSEKTLFAAEEHLGREGTLLLVESMEVEDLRSLAESSDLSIGSPLLSFLSPERLALVLESQMDYEYKNKTHEFSPLFNVLLGVFFQTDDAEHQGQVLDAVFDHRRSFLMDAILRGLEEEFSGSTDWRENPFFSARRERSENDSLDLLDAESEFHSLWEDSDVVAERLDDGDQELGIFSCWFADSTRHTGSHEDGGRKQFLYRLCEIRPEYARELEALFLCRVNRGSEESPLGKESVSVQPAIPESEPKVSAPQTSESMF